MTDEVEELWLCHSRWYSGDPFCASGLYFCRCQPSSEYLGFRFHFYSDEGTEPPHIHVESGDGECKFWLSPVALARNRGMSAVDIRKVERLVYEHQTFLLEKYDDFQSE